MRPLHFAQAICSCLRVPRQSCPLSSATSPPQASPALAPVSRRLRCRLASSTQLRYRLNASKTTFCELWKRSLLRPLHFARAICSCLRVPRQSYPLSSATSLHRVSPALARASRRLPGRLGSSHQPHSQLSVSRTTFCELWKHSQLRLLHFARAICCCLRVPQLPFPLSSATSPHQASPALAPVSRRLRCPRRSNRLRCRLNALKTTFCAPLKFLARKQSSSARVSWHCHLVYRQSCQAMSVALLHLASPAPARASRRLRYPLRPRRLHYRLNASRTMFCEPWKSSARKRFCSARAFWRCRLVCRRSCLATLAALLRLASPAPARASKRRLCRMELLRRPRSRLNASRMMFCELWRYSAHRQFSSVRASWHYRLVYQRCCLATSAASPPLASPAPARASRRLRCPLRPHRLRYRLNALKTMFYEPWRCSARKQFSSARAFWRCHLVYRQFFLAMSVALRLLASPAPARAFKRQLCRLG